MKSSKSVNCNAPLNLEAILRNIFPRFIKGELVNLLCIKKASVGTRHEPAIDLFNSRLRDVTNMADFRGKDTPKCIVVNGNNLGF